MNKSLLSNISHSLATYVVSIFRQNFSFAINIDFWCQLFNVPPDDILLIHVRRLNILLMWRSYIASGVLQQVGLSSAFHQLSRDAVQNVESICSKSSEQ